MASQVKGEHINVFYDIKEWAMKIDKLKEKITSSLNELFNAMQFIYLYKKDTPWYYKIIKKYTNIFPCTLIMAELMSIYNTHT